MRLAMVQEKDSRIFRSFSFSGTIGEQAAIENLKAGSADYLLEPEIRDRVPSAVRRAVQEMEERARLRAAEPNWFAARDVRTLTENSLDVLCILNRDGNIVYASPSIERVSGYKPEGGDVRTTLPGPRASR